MSLRQGDLEIYMTPDGGDIQNKNGEPVMDGGIENAAILSLFGTDDPDTWMNEYLSGSQKYNAQFYAFMIANSITLKNLLTSQEFAKRDLQWIIDDGIADLIDVQVTTFERNRINLFVGIYADNETLLENNYRVNWGYQFDDPAHLRIEQPIQKVYDIFNRITDGRDTRITDTGDTRVSDGYY